VNVFLDLPVGLKAKLWSHLLKNETEQVAFVFAAVVTTGDTTIFTAQDHCLAKPDDFRIHSEFHVELADETRAQIIKRAWDTGTAMIELHSHPGDVWGAMFSPSDMDGFKEFVPHCRWRLRGRRADRAPGRCRAGGGLPRGKDPTGRLSVAITRSVMCPWARHAERDGY
jgi:hypothetical protein